MALSILSICICGCGSGSMQDISTKAEKARTRAQLEAALGKPDKFEKVNMLGMNAESWTYKASDGEVNFTILNDKVTLTATQSKSETDSKSTKANVESRTKKKSKDQ